MATGDDLRRIALALTGTIAAPHFDRTAFKVVRTYATLAADGSSANVKLTPDAQTFKTMLAPRIYQPIPNAWGRQGWTTIDLAAIETDELASVLEEAYMLGAAPRPARKAKAAKAAKQAGRRP